ncbi:hypothetical protein COV19_03980 [Candidatus Woesearchaeota archaeon CG10_big_fil_rev_8_21_14_0_10_44_13]|nr:MAG: hypothetical protein COV19_03980 [Candidatus Woesearchaeota archaeon CG10_big_fil_rev_8_21_14_0_10_44_13]
MKRRKLPSVLEKYKFNKQGLIETDYGLRVPAYVASPLGFNVPGRFYLENIFYPKLDNGAGVIPLCPFKACAEYLGPMPVDSAPFRKKFNYWHKFNTEIIPEVNYGLLMPASRFMIAILEGHSVDEGVAAEIAHFSTEGYGPVIGIRTDFRLAENMAANINGAVQHFIDGKPYSGKFICGPDAYDVAMREIKTLADKIREETKAMGLN